MELRDSRAKVTLGVSGVNFEGVGNINFVVPIAQVLLDWVAGQCLKIPSLLMYCLEPNGGMDRMVSQYVSTLTIKDTPAPEEDYEKVKALCINFGKCTDLGSC